MSTRFQFACQCALVRMQGHARMLQPSSSGVMHAYVKERARDGTGSGSGGTSTPPHKKCAHGHARYGLCVQVLPRAGPTSTLCRASTRTACYSTSDVSEDTELPQPGVSQHHSLPRTTADARHATARQAPIRCPRARTRLRAKPHFGDVTSALWLTGKELSRGLRPEPALG